MEQLLERLIAKQVSLGIITKEEEALYRYGYVVLIDWVFNIAVAGLIGALTGSMQTTIIFLLSVIPLRSFGGGYHAATPVKCALISNMVLVFVIGLSEWLFRMNLPGWLFFLCELVLSVYFVLNAPVEAVTKPLTIRERRVYSICARLFYAVELAAMAGLYAAGREKNSITILFVHAFVVFSLWLGKYRNVHD